MFRCVVEMFGLPYEITGLREVEIELEDGATLGDVIAALRRNVSTLEGIVVCAGENRLTEYCAFNINGSFYSDDELHLQIQNGDRIILLTLATGG